MKTPLTTLLLLLGWLPVFGQQTPFERSGDKNYTAAYAQVISFYRQLALRYKDIRMVDYGSTDVGIPLSLVVLSRDRIFTPAQAKGRRQLVLLINNGIHPGEPEGIDASMMLARDLLRKHVLPRHVVICLVAVYNIGGCLNRGLSRINQNGPDAYGFRGNYRNLDLNRDFIKADSRNARTFEQIFNAWQPQVFLDNHTSDGADYQYVMTLIETQKDKQCRSLADYTAGKLTPELYRRMAGGGYEMSPYVEEKSGPPDSGIVGFLETPRFSTGYTTLHNTIGYITETHMLKPFAQRVDATYRFMEALIAACDKDAAQIISLKRKADNEVRTQHLFPLDWQVDWSRWDTVNFKGFAAGRKTSAVSGLPRLYYDRSRPYRKSVRYYDHYIASAAAERPAAYLIPQAWQEVIDRLRLNRVELRRLKHDTTLPVQIYYIDDYRTTEWPYEGHYLHSHVKLHAENMAVRFYRGDYLIFANQSANRYIVETLEPAGVDSFFAWNFFDSVLGEKEYFSDYVFEDKAAELLAKDSSLRVKLNEARRDPKFAADAQAQLYFIYKNSPWFEQTYRRYPVGRILDDGPLDLQ